jgi:hypothetical protein
MLGFLHRDAVDMIDFFTDLVVTEPVRASGQDVVVGRAIDFRAGAAEARRLYALWKFGHLFAWRRPRLIAFAHHHPSDVVEHRITGIVETARTHVDNAGLFVGVLFQPDDFGNRIQRGAWIDGLEKPAIGVAQIGNGIKRDVRHGLAEHDMKHQQIVDGSFRKADVLRKNVR